MTPMNTPSRNQPCPCGSGKKYKHCCGSARGAAQSAPAAQMVQFQQLVQAALAHHQNGDLDAAVPLYDQALALRPDDPGLLGLKGMLLLQQGARCSSTQITLMPGSTPASFFSGKTRAARPFRP
jgi:hypothetical protein